MIQFKKCIIILLIIILLPVLCEGMGEMKITNKLELEIKLLQKNPKLLIEVSIINCTKKLHVINKRMAVNDQIEVESNVELGEIYFDIKTIDNKEVFMAAHIEIGYLGKDDFIQLKSGERYTAKLAISNYYLIDLGTDQIPIEKYNKKIFLNAVYVNRNNGSKWDLKDVFIGEIESNTIKLN